MFKKMLAVVLVLGLSSLALATQVPPGHEIITTMAWGGWGATPGYYYSDVWDGIPLNATTHRERVDTNTEGFWDVQGLAIGDPGDDGYNHVYTARGYAGYSHYLEFEYVPGSGLTNQRQIWLTTEPAVYETYGIAVGDYDNNGSQDFLTLRREGGAIYLFGYDWDGTGEISGARTTLRTELDLNYEFYGVAVGDATNSGQNDIILTWGYAGAYRTMNRYRWENNSLVHQEQLYVTTEPAIYQLGAVAVGDTNGDGENELLYTRTALPGATTVQNMKWNGTTWDTTQVYLNLYEGGNAAVAAGLAVGDADNIIPEPATGLLFLGVLSGLFRRRRRAV